MAHISNFAPVVDVAADFAQFVISLESLCLLSASQSTGIKMTGRIIIKPKIAIKYNCTTQSTKDLDI